MAQAFLASIYKADLLTTLRILRAEECVAHRCQDTRGYTALHIAALNGNFRMIQFLVQYTQHLYSNQASEILRIWANAQTDEQFTALHFACFRGSLVVLT